MLKKLISEIVDPLLAAISPNWIDRYGGLVQTLQVKKVIDPKKPEKTQIQKYPISCSVNQTECNDLDSIYADLVPDESKSSIVYWEELSPMQFAGNVSNGSQMYKNYQLWKGKARLVVWLNAAKLGVGSQNDNYSCDWYFPFLDQLLQTLTTEGTFQSGDMQGGIYRLQPTRIAPKDLSIFSKYTYSEYINYHRYPYDYFAIDFEFITKYCVGANSVIPTGAVIACPFNQQPANLVNEYSMSFNGFDQYMQAPASSELSFVSGSDDLPCSFSVWVYTSGGRNQWIISKKKSNVAMNGSEYQLGILSNNKVFLTFLDKNTIGVNNYLEAQTVASLPLNQWVNIVATYDGSKTYAGLNIYLNGVSQSTNNSSVGTYTGMEETDSPLTIGKAGWVDNLYYGGYLEELSIWNTELDQDGVTEEYNGGLPTILTNHTKSANLQMWSRMGDNDTFTSPNWILTDNSSNNNTLTSTNMVELDRVANVPT